MSRARQGPDLWVGKQGAQQGCCVTRLSHQQIHSICRFQSVYYVYRMGVYSIYCQAQHLVFEDNIIYILLFCEDNIFKGVQGMQQFILVCSLYTNSPDLNIQYSRIIHSLHPLLRTLKMLSSQNNSLQDIVAYTGVLFSIYQQSRYQHLVFEDNIFYKLLFCEDNIYHIVAYDLNSASMRLLV